jgi:hypothetical protein
MPKVFYFLKKRKMKKITLRYRKWLENQRVKIPDSNRLTGSLIGKYPIILDGGRTTIFISDKSKESETKEKYQLRKDNRLFFFLKNPTHKFFGRINAGTK